MNRLTNKLLTTVLAAATLLSFGAVSLSAQAGGATGTATKAAAKAAKAPAAPPPTDAEIADATAKGLVWVNLNTKVYHKPGVATYGHTKNGKFMIEADAKAGGYKAAQEPMTKGSKKSASTAPAAAPK